MKIVELTPENRPLYYVCLEDWSDEMKEAGNHKEKWVRTMEEKSLRVRFAVDDKGEVGGMIEYMPIEDAFAMGQGLYFINCIWVHGYKKGRGNFQGRGMGEALLSSAEEDARELGAKGMAAWGLSLPFWMKASWFKKHGYKKVDRMGMMALMMKPFSDDVTYPKWIRVNYSPELTPGRVTVTSFINGQCPVLNMVHERAKRIASEFGEDVLFRVINTNEKDVMLKYGIKDALYIEKKCISNGPPLSYEKIKKVVGRAVKKLR
jgi:GNAT superfamily N-acetyltransferase